MIVKLIRESAIGEAIPSKLYVDGVFFGYGLENDNYKIPEGTYDLILKRSPSFGENKVYIDVPGRTNILIHGGNTADQTKGCVLVGAERNGATISGDQSSYLYDVVELAAKDGEGVALVVTNDMTKWAVLGVCFLGLMFFLKKGR